MLLPGMVAAQQASTQIIIVKSSDNSYFNQSIETLIHHVDQATEFKVVMAQELAEQQQSPGQKNLYVALGQAAVEAIKKLDKEIISINAYLTLEQYRRLKLDDQVTILLDQSLDRYLAFCKLLLQSKSVGLISEKKIDLNRRQNRLLENQNFELKQYQIDAENKLLPVLRSLLQQNDVLLMLPRQSIYNRDTLKGVLLTSYRNRIPAISYSPAHVKSGALASIYSSPVDIGRHLAILVNKNLKNLSQNGPAFEFARFYSIATNPRVARALGINLAPELELRSELDKLAR
jgi:ABC-type uncharacterized transport system substrate-binding protein